MMVNKKTIDGNGKRSLGFVFCLSVGADEARERRRAGRDASFN
jgi:hypothetical protein